MRFALKPNPRIPLDQVRVGSTSDARWRWFRVLSRVDRATAHEVTMADRTYAEPQQSVMAQVAEDTCGKHQVFCCAECFNMEPVA